MDTQKAVKKLEQQQAIITTLKNARERTSDPNFKKWERDTLIAIKKIFGEESTHANEFDNIRYSFFCYSSGTPDSAFSKAYNGGLETAFVMLASMIDEIRDYGLGNQCTQTPDVLLIVENLCQRFHRFARQLQSRHDNRSTIDINDEYDLQDLFHALLRLHFDDVREEEYTPSYAGASSRIDFVLKKEQIVVELKKTRAHLKTKEVGEQLIIDIARYTAHPDCKCLVCFVYDPEGKISNPEGLERDLEKQSNDQLKVRVIIAPKN